MTPLRSMKEIRTVLLLVIALNLAMIGIRVYLDPRLLGMPGGLQAAIRPSALLTFLAAIVTWATAGRDPIAQVIVREGTAVGLLCGVLEIAHITVENFGGLDARAESKLTGVFLLGLLLLWGYSGSRLARITGRLGAGMLSGSWSALVGMLTAMSYGFSQLFWGLPRLDGGTSARPTGCGAAGRTCTCSRSPTYSIAASRSCSSDPSRARSSALGAVIARTILLDRKYRIGISRGGESFRGASSPSRSCQSRIAGPSSGRSVGPAPSRVDRSSRSSRSPGRKAGSGRSWDIVSISTGRPGPHAARRGRRGRESGSRHGR